ncbi:MAG: hypothetical protein ACTHJ4_01455 [Candidatus Nucleicultricaceae bacterium]
MLKQDHNDLVHHVISRPQSDRGLVVLHMLPRDPDTIYVGASNNVYYLL